MEPNFPAAFSGPFKKITAVLAFLALAALPGFAQPANTVMLETWTGISGTAVSFLTSNANYPNTPGTRTYPTLYEQPSTSATDLGTRTRAFITPPTTGVYNFYIACDDACELWLSTTDNSSGRVNIASATSYTNPREWTKFTTQKSANITLTAGERYYIETLHKQGGGGGHLAVGWQGPGITGDAERPIPGSRLMPFQLITAPAVTTQPTARTVTSGQTATFTVAASGTGLTYQWRKNGVNIASSNSASYTTPATTTADNNASFTVKVSNAGGSATSNGATLTVTSGNTVPAITSQPGNTTVTEHGTATFTVGYTGSPTPAFEWYKNDVLIPGAPSSATLTLNTPNTAPDQNGAQYSVKLTNVNGTVTSAKATLTVNYNAKISPQPANASATVGNTAQFCIAYTANPAATVQWHKLPVGGTKAPISGQTGLCHTTPALTLADNGAKYSATVDNIMGSVSSNDAVLTVTQGTIVTDTLRAIKVVADIVVANVVVTTPKWKIPDYVFEPGYKVRSLAETEAYVKKHRHLPDVPGAAEMKKKGMSIGDMNLQLLKTVEEMTLHMIEMDKELRRLKAAESRRN